MRVYLVALLLLVSVSGCAFTDRQVVLDVPKLEDLNARSSSGSVIVITSFDDVRVDKSRVGAMRNGYGEDTANILTKQDVRGWVLGSLVKSLQQAGYRAVVVNSNLASPPGATGISVQLFRVFADSSSDRLNPGTFAEISAKISSEKNGQRVHDTIDGRGTQKNVDLFDIDGMYQTALESALIDFIGKATKWVIGKAT